MSLHDTNSAIVGALAYCEDYAKSQVYCWFRITYSKIGSVNPQWIVWFETINGQHGFPSNDSDLLTALTRFVELNNLRNI